MQTASKKVINKQIMKKRVFVHARLRVFQKVRFFIKSKVISIVKRNSQININKFGQRFFIYLISRIT